MLTSALQQFKEQRRVESGMLVTDTGKGLYKPLYIIRLPFWKWGGKRERDREREYSSDYKSLYLIKAWWKAIRLRFWKKKKIIVTDSTNMNNINIFKNWKKQFNNNIAMLDRYLEHSYSFKKNFQICETG